MQLKLTAKPMDIIPMKMDEINQYDVIKRLIRKEMSEKEASDMLRKSTRQIRRIKKRVKEEGAKGLIHKLRGQKSNNVLDEKESLEIKKLLHEKYYDFKPGFACEKLRERHGITRDTKTIRKIMIEEKLWKPRRKRIKEHRRWRQRRSHYGEMQQFDGSYHKWLDHIEKKACLLISIDDATGTITHGEFAKHEGVVPVFNFWKDYTKKNGAPFSIYVDKFSTYKGTTVAGESDTEVQTQFQRAMQEIGVEVITAHSPQAKGRVERAFKTLQDRLIKEMRLAGIQEYKEANKFLKDIFIPDFNARFAVPPREKTDFHKKLPKRILNKLDIIFCKKYERIVHNDHTVSLNKQWYQIIKTPSLVVYQKDKVTIEEHLDGNIKISLRGRYLEYKSLPQRPIKIYKPIPKKEKIYKPVSQNHPWKQFNPNYFKKCIPK